MYSLIIVDDEPIIAEGISKIVEWAEYGISVCRTTTSPTEALQFIRDNPVDILVTDIRMPDLDGIDLIRAAKAAKPGLRIIVLSGYCDFEYVRTASLMGIENYLLKPVNLDEMEKTLYNTIRRIEYENRAAREQHEYKRILRENILSLWVNGNIEPDMIREKLRLVGVDPKARTYRVIVIRLLHEDVRSRHAASDTRRAEELLARCYLSGSKCFLSFCNGCDEIVLVHMSGPGEEEPPDDEFYRQMADWLYRRCGFDVFICAGYPVDDPARISCCYNAARTISACSCCMGFHALFCAAGDITRPGRALLNEEQMRRLRLFAVIGDLCGASEYIKNLMDARRFPSSRLPELFITVVYNLYIEIEMTFSPVGIGTPALRKKLPPIEEITCADDCLDAFGRTIGLLQQVYFSSEPRNGGDYVAGMKKVVQHHYSQYISLKTLADEFGVSPSYLGSLFIHETGEPFSSYVNRIRIEKAKILLIDRQLRISDISRMTGFTTANYFHAIFKKHTGFSPAEYRERMNQSGCR